MRVITELQEHEDKGAQVAGLTAAFILLSVELGISVNDLIVTTKNIMNHADGMMKPEFSSVSQYIRNEICQ